MGIETRPGAAVDLIHQARQIASRDNPGDLPRVNPSLFTARERNQMFDLASSAWNTVFKSEEIRQNLLPTDSITELQEQYTYLKGLRKYGLILKTGYLLFDQRNIAPEPFHMFVQELGQLNDRFFTPEGDNYKKRVIDILDTVYTPETTLDFQPADDVTYSTQVENMKQVVARPTDEASTSVTTFHDARKALRHFMNIYQLATALWTHPDHTHMFGHLQYVNDQLGSRHDEIVEKANGGEIDYETSLVALEPELKTTLLYTLDAFSA